MMTIRRARAADLPAVLSILQSAAHWLHERGYDQWPDGSPTLGPGKIGAQITRGEFWLVADDGAAVACIAISDDGDTDFWTPTELAEPAAYLSKLAVARPYAGRELGALLLRWACDHAVTQGARWVRLDVWRTNVELQAYYRRRGWGHLRTEEISGRRSGALFQRAAARDPKAAAAFAMDPAPVIDWSYGIVATGWEHGEGGPSPLRVVAG